METKTRDNVFVTIPISVQNRVRPEKVYDAYYKLSDPVAQIKSYVEQVILGHVPGMTLDEVVRVAVQHRGGGQAGAGCRYGGIRIRDCECAGDRYRARSEGEVGDERYQRGAAGTGCCQRKG
jgi:hypothetical protein